MDCVIPFAPKDRGTLPHCVAGIRAQVADVDQLWVVSGQKNRALVDSLGLNVRFISDEEVVERVCGGERPDFYGWHLQQLIKLAAYTFVDTPRWLVVDSDTIFLNPTRLTDGARVVFSTDDGLGDRGGRGMRCRDYRMLYESLVGLPFDHETCCVAHHMVFDRDAVDALLQHFRAAPWWRALEHPDGAHRRFSEYDFYASFLKTKYPERVTLASSRGRWLNASWRWWEDAALSERFLAANRARGWRYVSCHEWLSHATSSAESAIRFAEQCDDEGADLSRIKWQRERQPRARALFHEARTRAQVGLRLLYLRTLGRKHVRI